METRKATIGDAEGVAKVLTESYNISDVKEGVQVFEDELEKGHHYIVALSDGNVVGIVTWHMHGLPKHQLCELVRIAVLPDFRGKGVAKELFEALKEDAGSFYSEHGSKLRKLFLLTHDDNERAHAFYEKIGFSQETTLKQHYYADKDERVYSIFF